MVKRGVNGDKPQQYLSTAGLHVCGLPLQPLLHRRDLGSRLPRGCLQCHRKNRIAAQPRGKGNTTVGSRWG